MVTMALKFLCVLVSALLTASQFTILLPIKISATNQDEYLNVDLAYLVAHKVDFLSVKVRTMGIVRFYVSFYMFEDFWLEASTGEHVPTVVRPLTVPPEGSVIEVFGIVMYSDLEGGFYYFNASEWSYQPRILCDLNFDGKVDIVDIIIVAIAFGSTPFGPRWNPVADINRDKTVDILDLIFVALDFGKHL